MDVPTAIITNPFAFLGAAWLALPVIIGGISSLIALLGRPEVLIKWDKQARKAALSKLLLAILVYDLFVACLSQIIRLTFHFLTVPGVAAR